MQVHLQGAADGPSSAHEQADIDIVNLGIDPASPAEPPTAIELAISDAEVIVATCAAIGNVTLLEGCRVTIRVSHAALLAAVLVHLGVEAQHQQALLREVGALMLTCSSAEARKADWASGCKRLRARGISHTVLGRCKPFVLRAPLDPVEALDWLAMQLPPSMAQAWRLQQALAELRALLAHLAAWGVSNGCVPSGDISVSIVTDAFMSQPASYCRGVAFQLFVTLPAAATGADHRGDARSSALASAPVLVAHGGRYDALLQALWPQTLVAAAVPPLHATGATLNVDRLVQLAARRRNARAAGSVPETPTQRVLSLSEVLVCSRGGGGMLRERMAVVQSLWAAGIAAETVPRASPSVQAQFAHAHARGVRALVSLAPEAYTHNQRVKVRAKPATFRCVP